MSNPAGLPIKPGDVLMGKYRVDRVLGSGGMGAVLAATHLALGHTVALKVMLPGVASDVQHQRFLREARASLRLRSEHVARVLDVGTMENAAPYMLMELLEGRDLMAEIKERGVLGVAEAVDYVLQACHAVAEAHAAGIVHRDIKPANVFLTRTGHAKLLDFGLARIRDGQLSLIPTAVGIVMGTAGYLSPEQARGQPDEIDARTDLFAVGALLYRALTGRRIHEQPNAVDMTLAAMRTPVPSLAFALPTAGPALVAAVDRALAFERGARWQTAREMFEALRTAYSEEMQRRTVSTAAEAPSEAAGEAAPEGPSLVVEVAFGDEHDVVIDLERKRTREVIDSLSSIEVRVDSSSLRGSQ
jgi:serine/threonine-protein kinase